MKWQLVPEEPTKEQYDAGINAGCGIGGSPPGPRRIYAAMLAAAPQPERDHITKEDAQLYRLIVGHQRYETARRMNPRAWSEAWQLSITTGKPFDEIIDDSPFVAGWEVRQVEGEPWPGMDSEGDTCYENSHFACEADALTMLTANAKARLCSATRSVAHVRASIALAEKECVDAALLLERLEGKN